MAEIPSVLLQPADLACLSKYARGKRCLVEIGTFLGASACVIRSVMAADGILYCVDPYNTLNGLPRGSTEAIIGDPGYAYAALKHIERGTLCFAAARSQDFVQHVNFNPDFIFIDGDHSYTGVAGDFELWIWHLAPGAAIVFHDAAWGNGEAGPLQLTDELLLDHRVKYMDQIGRCRVFKKL